MTGAVLVKSYDEPEFRIDQILRYAGCKDGHERTLRLVGDCIEQVRASLVYKVCYRPLAVSHLEGLVDLEFARSESDDLAKHLEGCDKAVLFAATVGLEIDRMIARFSHSSPAKALILGAIGSERIESLCDLFCADIKEQTKREGKYTRPRFSPGYGDLPLLMQRDIFKVLDCPRKIGLSLNESMLMSPSKSVTAFIGISGERKTKNNKNCSSCKKTDCAYRS